MTIVVIPKRKMLPLQEDTVQPGPMIPPSMVITPPSPVLDTAVVFIIDGGGSAITTGEKGHVRLPFAGTIINVALAADQAGSIVVDIWKDTTANFPPTVADTITASAKPTLSGAQSMLDVILTGWTKTFAAGDYLAFKVDSVATITRVTLTLVVRRT